MSATGEREMAIALLRPGSFVGVRPWQRLARFARIGALLGGLLALGTARADEPTAPPLDYHLENARIELRFDVDQRKVIGQVTHTLSLVRDGLRQLDFDSVGLSIASVSVN